MADVKRARGMVETYKSNIPPEEEKPKFPLEKYGLKLKTHRIETASGDDDELEYYEPEDVERALSSLKKDRDYYREYRDTPKVVLELQKENGKPKIELTWEQCKMIASYYRFPTAVFLLTEKHMRTKLKGKRKDAVLDKLKRIENCELESCGWNKRGCKCPIAQGAWTLRRTSSNNSSIQTPKSPTIADEIEKIADAFAEKDETEGIDNHRTRKTHEQLRALAGRLRK